MKKNNKKIFNLMMVLALSAALLAGCAATPKAAVETHNHDHEQEAFLARLMDQSAGGVLCLKINPEIAVHYDENGKVNDVVARNADGAQILQGFTGYQGKDTSTVLEELVKRIGEAGYFVEEAEGEARKVVLELDPGSNIPHETFLEDMAAHVKLCIENKEWVGERDYEYETTAPTEATKAATPATQETVPAGLCPVCADDDCDDGAKCDDADEKAENLREYEANKNKKACTICGEKDCDDGKDCDGD